MKVDRHFFRFRSDDEAVCWQMTLNGLGIGTTWVKLGEVDPRVSRILPPVASEPFPIWLAAHVGVTKIRRIRYVFDYLAEHIAAKI